MQDSPPAAIHSAQNSGLIAAAGPVQDEAFSINSLVARCMDWLTVRHAPLLCRLTASALPAYTHTFPSPCADTHALPCMHPRTTGCVQGSDSYPFQHGISLAVNPGGTRAN